MIFNTMNYVVLFVVSRIQFAYSSFSKHFLTLRQYIKYPENPNTNVKEKIQELANEKERTRQQRMAYKEQLLSLQEVANRSKEYTEKEASNDVSWWRRAGRWIGGGTTQP